MDWCTVIGAARAILVTAEEDTRSATARALGRSQPTLGRQGAALELQRDVARFERVERELSLTPGGLERLEHARARPPAGCRGPGTRSRSPGR
ncbi:MAG: LysR family transcriptional regulator, partial [Myxococcales bacterium]|nr:LysR family transcriptional regulator [Myxococcales bacterium]